MLADGGMTKRRPRDSTQVQGSVMCGRACGCGCNMGRSERFGEMRICRVGLSCGVGLRVRCAVMQRTARVFGSRVPQMGQCRLGRALPRPLFRGGVQTWRTEKGRERQGCQ